VVLSGGVFQNELLLAELKSLWADGRRQVLTNQAVPPNDGGISLGQAALAAFRISGEKAARATSASAWAEASFAPLRGAWQE